MHVNERSQTKTNKKKQQKKQSHHIQIDDMLYCSILSTNNAIVSINNGLTVWRQVKKEDFLQIIYHYYLFIVQIQFSLIKKKIGRPEHSQTPYPLHLSNIISFLSYPSTPPPPAALKVDVICVSPLIPFITFLAKMLLYFEFGSELKHIKTC